MRGLALTTTVKPKSPPAAAASPAAASSPNPRGIANPEEEADTIEDLAAQGDFNFVLRDEDEEEVQGPTEAEAA